MTPFPEQRIDEHLDVEIGAPSLTCELVSINNLLDAVNVPRDYPDSEVPCSTRERVRALVNLCLMRGTVWSDGDSLETEVF